MLGTRQTIFEKLRTKLWGASRIGTLCCLFAVLVFATGCPPRPPVACTDDAFCDDNNGCTTDTCDVATGDCTNEAACDDDHCVEDACVDCLADDECDDGLFCNGAETCGADGMCADGTAPCGDDGLFCNGTESCDEAAGACVSSGDPCAAGETCNEATGACECADDADCDDGDACNGAETCVGGACTAGTPLDCDDGLACTDDSCVADACVNTAVTCAVGETCIEPDGCTAAIPCPNGDADCDDSDLCTTDACGADGFCAFTAVVCDDSDACTTDTCDPADGACVFTDVVCATGESCIGGVCTPIGSFNFTLEDDTLTGTPYDDIFTAGIGTLNPGDIAVGNGGNDVLNALIVGATAGDPTLIDIDTMNFTTLNNATFDGANCAAIGAYGVAGASAGSLTLVNVEGGVDLSMGSGFDDMLDVDFSGAGADFTLTINGTADGASFDCQDGGLDVDLVVGADSFLGCGVPGTDCFGGAGSVTVTGSADLTLTGAQPGDLNADGGAYDMSDFTGMLTVMPEADGAYDYDFSTGGADELEGVDQVTIVDTETFAHSFTFDDADDDITVDISGIDEDDLAGALGINQGADDDDMLTLILGGDGDGMGALGAPATEFVNIVSGGTTANAIAGVTTVTGTAFVTESVTVTGDQDCDLGTVTTESFDSTGLDAAAGVTLTAGAGMQVNTGDGDDDITGSAAGDQIDAGGGDDAIVGGAGADRLTGGADSDTFQFNAAGDSGITRALADDIIDFAAGAGGDVMAFDDTGGFALTGTADTLAFEIESDGAFAAGTNVFVIDTTGVANLFGDLTATETALDGLVNAAAGAGGGIFVVYDATTDAVYAVYDDDVTADSGTGADLTAIFEMGLDGSTIANSGIADLVEANFAVLP